MDDEFLALLRANDATYAPTLVVGGFWTRARGSIALGLVPEIDDPNGCVDLGTRAKLGQVAELRPLMPEAQRSAELFYRRLEAAGRSGVVMAENLRRVHGAGLRVVAATDAGNPLTLHGPSIYAELEAMQGAGIGAAAVVVMATRNGAIAMNRGADFGTLEAGKIADLLVLEADPTRDVSAFRRLTHVMRAGVLHEQGALAWR